MRRIVLTFIIACIFASLFTFPAQGQEGYFTNFEEFPSFTRAAALNVPGMTFVSNSGAWQIYSGYTSAPYVVGKALETLGGELRINFATPQASIQFGYRAYVDIQVTGSRNGSAVALSAAVLTPTVTGAWATISAEGGIDSLVLNTPSDIVIDNLSTTFYSAPSCNIPPLDNAVVGRFISGSAIYWEPGKLTSPVVTIGVGESAWIYGVDATGEYYKIAWSCQTRWVAVDTMGPNYDDVWQGRPLPTEVVE